MPNIKTISGAEVEAETDPATGIVKRKGWKVSTMPELLAGGEDAVAEWIARAEGISVKKAKDKLKKAREQHERDISARRIP